MGAYLLGDVIGRGGMGVVYRATHVHLGRDVALKLLAPQLGDNDDFRARFLRESRLAASLDHPNVVTVYDAGDVDGTLYIAMRYVRGTDLEKLLSQHGRLEPARTVALLDQVAAALEAAHELGLVHRDVKPANVMIASERCYLTDFGLTKRSSAVGVSGALTRTGQFMGTLAYIAPEQIEGREVDGRADVYALACLVYECLTGSRPYVKDSEVATIYAHLQDPPPRPTDLRRELPVAIDDVVAKGMAKSAEDRYSTCGKLIDAARAALFDRATVTPSTAPKAATGVSTAPHDARPPSSAKAATELPASVPGGRVTSTRGSPPGRRRRALWFGAAVVVGVLLAVAVIELASGGASNRTSAVQRAGVLGVPIAVGKAPTGIAGNARVLWVANSEDSTVTRVTKDGKVRTDIPLPRGPFSVISTGQTFWVSSANADQVTPITVSTGLPGKPIRVGRDPSFLAGDENSVFVSNAADGTVTVLDARTGAPIGTPIRVGKDPQGIASGGTAVWVADAGNNNVDRIVNGRVIKTIPVGRHPVGVAVGDNAVWVANEVDNTVSRIDLAGQGANVKTIPVGKAPFGIAFGFGSAWVTNKGEDTLTRLDARTGEPLGKRIPLGKQPTGIAVVGDSVWVTNSGSDNVQQLKP